MPYPLLVRFGIFCGCPQPDVRIAVAPITWQHLFNVLRPFGKNLPVNLIASTDKIEEVSTPYTFDLIVEHVS